MEPREQSFLDEVQRLHAAGRDLNARCRIFQQGDDSVGVAFSFSAAEAAWHEIQSLLYFAAVNGWCSSIVWLLAHGADVNNNVDYRIKGESTALSGAARGNRLDALAILLDAGARVEDGDDCGWTALHKAASWDLVDMCKLLLSRGASLDARNTYYDQDAEDIAEEFCKHTTRNLLAAVRAAGGWAAYVHAPRAALLALRRELPSLRDHGRAAPSSSVRAHERLFLDTPDDVFTSVLAFWRSDRDSRY